MSWGLECISKSRLGDSKLDCIGGTDEDARYPVELTLRLGFLCLGELEIIRMDDVCDGVPDCSGGEDERLCEEISPDAIIISLFCSPALRLVHNEAFKYESCYNIERFRASSYLSLFNPVIYPEALGTIQAEGHLAPLSRESDPISDRTSMVDVSHQTASNTQKDFYCLRGFGAYVANSRDENVFGHTCFCPPSYYGTRCQYQNDRVALTLRLRSIYNHRVPFIVLIRLMDQHHHINSYHTFHYLSSTHCDRKFNIYLLYSAPMKDRSKSYSVHINLFRLDNLQHHTSWYLPVHSFRPVIRIATLLRIPIESASRTSNDRCALRCKYGQCLKYEKSQQHFCLCQSGWSGPLCDTLLSCECAGDSLCIGHTNDQPICLCPHHKMGPRCFIRSICNARSCNNGGICVILHEGDHLSRPRSECVCSEEFIGLNCDIAKTPILFEFLGLRSYPFMVVHLIETFPGVPHNQTMIFDKIPPNHNAAVVYSDYGSRLSLIIVQFHDLYYLAYVQKYKLTTTNISTSISPKQQCPHTRTLVDSRLAKANLLKLAKQYPNICLQRTDLACFHDEYFMCLCTADRFANCFHFKYEHDIACVDENPCENQGICFQDRPKCPSTTECICAECYYGTRCQFSTAGFGTSLDAIIGYQIEPSKPLSEQPTVVKVTVALAVNILAFGLVSSLLSTITFKSRRLRETGCGNYLLASSVSSLLTIIMLTLKVLFLLLAQMVIVTGSSFLLNNCLWMDALTAICLSWNAWLNACVAVERTFYVIRGLRFQRRKSKQVAKWMIIFSLICIAATYVQDPLHRKLLNDEYERRIWCIVRYPRSLQGLTSFLLLFHFVMPFAINVISIVVIVLITARNRFLLQKQNNYSGQVLKQLQLCRNLLISTGILVLLSVPRLLLAWLSGCMKSTREPWLFLAGYFIAFLPTLLIFPVFVLTSDIYRQEFQLQTKQLFKKLIQVGRRF